MIKIHWKKEENSRQLLKKILILVAALVESAIVEEQLECISTAGRNVGYDNYSCALYAQ